MASEPVPPRRSAPARSLTARLLLWSVQMVAAALGAWQGWGFGREISGLPLAVTLAVVTAVFAALMVDALADALDRLRERGSGAR
jgi:hypothetical protein